jgi:hypothetical protein
MTSPLEAPNKPGMAADYRGWLAALGVSLGTALLIVSPFFWLGTASGHDISFHASSWLDAAGQWKEGIVYPRWTEWANYGFGEPRFIFYPPLSWMLGAALGIVAPWNAVPGVFIVLVQTLGGVCMFALGRRFFSTGAAAFGAACYAANPYALLVVYMRSDFAEELACAFLPLLVLVALQLCGLVENRWRSQLRASAIFALLFAAMWLSNAPAGVMASYSVALLFAWAALREKSFAPLWRGAGGLALGFSLACFYLLPAAYEQRWVSIAQALSSGLRPEQNFVYAQINDPEHNLFNWIASTVAVLLIVVTGIAALVAYRSIKGREPGEKGEGLWLTLLLLSAAATVLMLRPSFLLWEYLPKLRFVQFPWRWMGILAVPYAYFAAAAMERRRAGWIWVCVVILVSAGSSVFLVRQAWWDSDDIPSLRDAIASDQGFEGTDEYDPVGDDHYNLPQNAPPVQILPAEDYPGAAPKAQIRIARWTAEERELSVSSSEPLRLAIRLLDYPAWRAQVDAQAVTPQHAESTGQLILPLPAGAHRIRMRFGSTPDRMVGGALSLASLVVCGAFLRKRRSENLQAVQGQRSRDTSG